MTASTIVPITNVVLTAGVAVSDNVVIAHCGAPWRAVHGTLARESDQFSVRLHTLDLVRDENSDSELPRQVNTGQHLLLVQVDIV